MDKRNGLMRTLFRGLRGLCPRCGRGKLYHHWYRLRSNCENCHLTFIKDAIDILAFMYISTAFITGLFILGMFIFIPANKMLGTATLVLLAVGLIVGTLPYRKGVAIALDFWIEEKRS